MINVCVVQNVSLERHLALSTYLSSLVQSLAGTEKAKITVLTSKGYETTSCPQNAKVFESGTDLYTLSGNLRFIFWAVFALISVGRRERIDVIHCLYPFSSTVACVLYKWLFSPSTKVVYDIRSPWIDMGKERGNIRSWMRKIVPFIAIVLENVILQLVDGAIFITQGLRNHYTNLGIEIPSDNIVSPSGVSLERFNPSKDGNLRRKLNLEDDMRVIGYVGGIAKTRKLDFLLKAYFAINQYSETPWALVFIGDGDDRERLESLVKELELEHVYFLGKLRHSKIPSIVAGFDYGVCHLPTTPLFNTSFPMKVLEYLACGVPVLMSDMPAHRELHRKLSGTFLYDFNPEDFAQVASTSLHAEKPVREELQEYSWNSIARHLMGFYVEVF